jgi:diguanylate cyclase (GGDEF)-like protein/PAS domain S-box-containing protein
MKTHLARIALASIATGAAFAVFDLLLNVVFGESWQLFIGRASFAAAAAALTGLDVSRKAKNDREKLQCALSERELLLESVEVTPAPYALYDKQDRLVAWNKSYQELHEPVFSSLEPPLHYADLMRATLGRTLPPDAVEKAVAERVAAQKRADGTPYDRAYAKGWYRVCKQRTRSGAIAGFASDITELKRREADLGESEARYRALAETSPTGIWRIDASGEPLYANQALIELLGVAPDAPGDLRRLLETVSNAMLARRQARQGSGRFEAQLYTASGERRHVLVVTTEWLSSKDETESCIATLVDITELKAAQDRVEHLATHDVLTGLGNRALFGRRLEAAVAASAATPVSLIAVDLDHFKEVNDRYGHSSGDAVLQETAARMRASAREKDLICRLGGDEFALLLEGATREAAREIAFRVLHALTSPFTIEGHELRIGASIGIAGAPSDGTSAEELLHKADIALYRIKRQGRCDIGMFAEESEAETQSAAIEAA